MLQYVSLNGIFERTHILMGFENAVCAALEDPEEYGALLVDLMDGIALCLAIILQKSKKSMVIKSSLCLD